MLRRHGSMHRTQNVGASATGPDAKPIPAPEPAGVQSRVCTTMNKRALNLAAIRHDPKNADAYHNLACTLRDEETVVLHDGRTMNQKSLFCESIRLDPDGALAFHTRQAQRREVVDPCK